MNLVVQNPSLNPADRLAAELPQPAVPLFNRFYHFLCREVHFSWAGSLHHTYRHCARVLLFTLVIGTAEQVTESLVYDAALSAVFHDSRRQDDGYDVGHGLRAARYYRQYALAHDHPFSGPVYAAIALHDRDDALAINHFHHLPDEKDYLTVWRLLKDADALDRLRFGDAALDPRYLRTETALNYIDKARRIVRADLRRLATDGQ